MVCCKRFLNGGSVLVMGLGTDCMYMAIQLYDTFDTYITTFILKWPSLDNIDSTSTV